VARFANAIPDLGPGDDPIRLPALATARVRKHGQIGARFGFGVARPHRSVRREQSADRIVELVLFGAVPSMIIRLRSRCHRDGPDPGTPQYSNSRYQQVLIDGAESQTAVLRRPVSLEPPPIADPAPECRELPGRAIPGRARPVRIAAPVVTFSVRNDAHLGQPGVLPRVEFEIHHPFPTGFSMLAPAISKRYLKSYDVPLDDLQSASAALAEIAASAAGPEMGAFFDLDGTLVTGFTAADSCR